MNPTVQVLVKVFAFICVIGGVVGICKWQDSVLHSGDLSQVQHHSSTAESSR